MQSAAKNAGKSLPQVLAFHLDVTDSTSVHAAADAVRKAAGRLDLLVNNAGFMTPAKVSCKLKRHCGGIRLRSTLKASS